MGVSQQEREIPYPILSVSASLSYHRRGPGSVMADPRNPIPWQVPTRAGPALLEVAMGREIVPSDDEALRMLVKKNTMHGRPAS
jgi:hypothetical protein